MAVGRKPTTGKFDSRETLEEVVFDIWNETGASFQTIGKITGISGVTAARIVDSYLIGQTKDRTITALVRHHAA